MASDLSKVVERTDLIENLLDQIIFNYTLPRDEAKLFFRYILLDSSVITLGAKVKVVTYIANEELKVDKLDTDSLHGVIRYRNAFAHHGLQSHPTLAVGRTPEENKEVFKLHIITGSGKLIKVTREKALKKFEEYFENAKKGLVKIKELIKT